MLDLDQAADEIRAEAPGREPEGSSVLEELADELEALDEEAAAAEPTVDAQDLVARAIENIEDALGELQASGSPASTVPLVPNAPQRWQAATIARASSSETPVSGIPSDRASA